MFFAQRNWRVGSTFSSSAMNLHRHVREEHSDIEGLPIVVLTDPQGGVPNSFYRHMIRKTP